DLELICQRSETADQASKLRQQNMTMLSLRHGQNYETRLKAVEARSITDLCRLARRVVKDKDAVVAGLTLPYSNGRVEAQVHKLKLVKRSIFGHAKPALLRQRLLHAA